MSPRLDVVRHLALYTAFHRSRGNRVAHAVSVPAVLVSMLFLQAYLRLPSAPLLHVGTVLTVGFCAVIACIDLLGAAVLLVALVPACQLAATVVARAPATVVVPGAIAIQLVGWFGTVVVGHCKIEPWLDAGAGHEDSNVYFRRGYYLARHLGTSVGGIDALVQFCVAPLAVAQDALLCLGLRRSLQRAIETEQERILARLARDEAPLPIAITVGGR